LPRDQLNKSALGFDEENGRFPQFEMFLSLYYEPYLEMLSLYNREPKCNTTPTKLFSFWAAELLKAPGPTQGGFIAPD